MKSVVDVFMPTEIGEAEECDIIVCNREEVPVKARYAATNVHSKCAECGAGIYHRPHLPEKVKKVCQECAMKQVEEAKARGEEVVTKATAQTVLEVLQYLESQKLN